MKRKIVQHGESTLTVSLPSKWTKLNKLKKGQYVDISFSNERLIISTKDKYMEDIATDITKNKQWYISRILRHLYTAGYDEINIKYSSQDQLNLIRENLRPLTGLEVIESKPSFCKLKCTVSVDETDYSLLIKRAMWLILSQFDYFLEDCGRKKPLMASEVSEIFQTFVRLCNLCRRQINKKNIYDAVNSKYAYDFINGLVEISIYLVYSYDQLKKDDKINLSEKELSFIQRIRDMYYDLLMAYQNVSIDKTKSFFENRKGMFDDVLNLLSDKNPIIIHYFLIILRNFTPIGNHIIMLHLENEKKSN